MDFKSAIFELSNLLESIGTKIDTDNYDGLIVKKLQASNTLDEGRTTKQSHIAITGSQMDIFPYLKADGYFNASVIEGPLKKYFVVSVPVNIRKKNIVHIAGNDAVELFNFYNKEIIDTYTCVFRNRRTDQADQIQISLINKDGPDFIQFRRLMHAGFFWILLKRRNCFEYDSFGVRVCDETEPYIASLNEMNNNFYFLPTNTIVSVENFDVVDEDELYNEEPEEEMNFNYLSGYDCEFPRNRILFGAPGTGKSFTLNKECTELLKYGGYSERVTFHPDYTYANFVGTYKPTPAENDTITYSFVPGPFMRTYVKAMQNCKCINPLPHVLIIEEINRANVAAVFGDVFQLLDRKENNASEYPIQASEDVKKYLSSELGGSPDNYSEIRIPDNMFIWATMNSADQGVFPMDTAFKRRWDFTYLGIDDGENGISNKKVVLGEGEYKRIVDWNKLRKAINEELLTYKLNEDKLMGPYFIAKKDIPDGDWFDKDSFMRIFKNKVLMYLFDDAAKQKRLSLFGGCDEKAKNQYSKICKEFEQKGVFIFCDAVSNRFIDTVSEDDAE